LVEKARRDLLSAKRLARGTDPYLDTAIYHCQQCIEKSIKVGWFIMISLLRRRMIFVC
jgi:HEPN domain-containing protein